MKTLSTLIAALATSAALFAAPAVHASQSDTQVNPFASLPYYGSDHQRRALPGRHRPQRCCGRFFASGRLPAFPSAERHQYNRSSITECATGFRLAHDRFRDTAA